jgi:hypothetical protein
METAASVSLAEKPINRNKRRLHIASGLLKCEQGADVLSIIRGMPESERERLRSMVDWVEEYEKFEI